MTFKSCRTCEGKHNRNRFIMVGVAVSLAIILSVFISVKVVRSNKTVQTDSPSQTVDEKPWLDMRLRKSIVPDNYSLFLDVSMETFLYNGVVTVYVQVINNTNFVLLHQVGLNITETMIERIGKGRRTIPIKRTFSYIPNEFWVIETEEKLEARTMYAVTVKFDGVITSDLSGFYRNVYVDKKGKTKKLVSTFFSPVSARKAYPCFDEPAFKARFQITIKHNSEYTALSNMPVSLVKKNNGNQHTTVFKPSLKMSTYIVCWVICTFKYKTLDTPRGLTIKAWSREDIVDQITFSLNATEVLLHNLEEYFNNSFPLKKLDMVAVPSFGPGAMENWGLITYREDRMLIKNALPSDSNRLSYTTIAHELVHQWFGNLATMKFWTEVWLKEGFATFVGKLIGNEIYPSLELMKNVLPDLIIPALQLDAFATSNPISTQATTPDEIREVFGVITYMKGYCVVHMLNYFMGETSFRKGLQRYLRRFAYSNANQDDLWEQLSLEAHGKNIKAVMDTWTLQMGYPVITIKSINSTHVRVEQLKFSLDPPGTDLLPSPYNYTWHVPIIFKDLTTNETYDHLLKTKHAIIKAPPYSILNPNHNLYYRVNYHKQMIVHLTETLQRNHTSLSVFDRTGLISDQFALLQAKLTNLTTVVNIIKYLKNETDYVPWIAASSEIKMIKDLLEGSPKEEKKWKRFMTSLIENYIQRTGWKNSTKESGELQVILLKLGCSLNITSVVKESESLFRNWMIGIKTLGKDLQAVMMECTISHNSYQENKMWQFAYNAYLTTKDSDILAALAHTRNEMLLDRLLNDSMNHTIVRPNAVTSFIGNIAKASRIGRKRVWMFVKRHWYDLREKYGNNIFLLSRMFTAVFSSFSTSEQLEDVKGFFKDKHLGSGEKSLHQAKLEIKFKIWYKETLKESTWFQENNPHHSVKII